MLQTVEDIQVDHRADADSEFINLVHGRIQREATAARSARLVQHPGATGGERIGSPSVEFWFNADANH